MKIKTKALIISVLLIIILIISIRLFFEYNALHNSMTTNLFITGKALQAEARLIRLLKSKPLDIEAAKEVIKEIVNDIKTLDKDLLTIEESYHIKSLTLSFIQIGGLLEGLQSNQDIPEAISIQIDNEILKIEDSLFKFRQTFKERMDKEIFRRANLQLAIFATTGIGIFILFFGFYRLFLMPIFFMSNEIKAVREGKKDNITIYKSTDELGYLTLFTYQMLDELRKSAEALSERYGMQYALSEILMASQKIEDINLFLKKVIDIILSVKWLNIQIKAGISLVSGERLVLVAEKNFPESQLRICSDVPIGVCLCGKAVQRGESIYKPSCDDYHENRWEGMPPHGHYCVPIKHMDKVLGVINLYLEEGYVLSKTEMEFINTIAIVVAETLTIKKLSESEHLITMAIEESGEGVIIMDRHGLIEYVNPAIERITGYLEEELLGKNLITGIHPWVHADEMNKSISNGNLWFGTLRNKRKDGTDYYVHISLVPVKDINGDVKKFVSIIKDVTKERSLEEQLRHSQKMEVIGQLAAGVAHDFNNILTAIIGYGNLLQNKLLDEKMRDYVHEILLSSERAANLTKSLLAFSRKQVINLQPVDLNEIVRGMEKFISKIIKENIELKFLLSDNKLNVMADKGQIEQALMNLVTNASDAMPEGGLLVIKTDIVNIDEEYVKSKIFDRAGPHACISVTDTGIGMDEKTIQRIFEPFYTTKEIGKGTGLGLPIVYGIIKQHGGNIKVYSEKGEGTTFRIYLPLISAEIKEKAEKEIPLPKFGTELILFAEDDDTIRKLIKDVLEEYGYKLIEAHDGDEAVKLFKENKNKIDMILFDVILPKKNGIEAYEEIKKINPDIKALFISGYAEEIIHKKQISETGLNFISKPIFPNELLIKIREVLSKYNQ